ncbi:hypothetical protein FQA47_017569 [Oryzias melastigma]|uniref:Uncharacterized protein n=1 Tax=Oryzias melastigma TaxID=30732 RepID=A0A834CJD8_ORYME|nr:hypothetical protein FQA47_017569 [Oryzias melastigma]
MRSKPDAILQQTDRHRKPAGRELLPPCRGGYTRTMSTEDRETQPERRRQREKKTAFKVCSMSFQDHTKASGSSLRSDNVQSPVQTAGGSVSRFSVLTRETDLYGVIFGTAH